jgi:hypothetical protein
MREYIRKLWFRNALTLLILFIFCVVFFWAGTAWGEEAKKPKKAEAKEVSLPQRRPEIKLAGATTTTTTSTTTTTAAPATTTKPPAPAYTPSGDWIAQCHAWAAMAGITLNDSAIKLIDVESDCNPTIMNKAGSGAGGIPQALPASKMGCTMNYDDISAICQLQWMNSYVNRWGGWDGAWQFWNCIGICRGINKTSTWY